ncbi:MULTISPECIES: ACT domain-containing protein [Marinobacter]|nr:MULTISPECIES: ACT domain-containing protein [Marinobacter]MCD1630599.1 ACT domain-containing protein [Marinobacter shengliensis]
MSAQAQTELPSYTLNCRMNQEAAALERLCQVVRVRGFQISRMTMEAADNHLDIALTLSGSRPIGMLRSQLEKLHTVVDVALQEQAASARSVSA